MNTVKDAASEMKDRVSDFASEAREKASQMADSVAETANRSREKAAQGLHKAAAAIDKAGQISSARASDAAHKVAQGLDSTASYVEGHGLPEMGEDVMNIFRRYPAQAILGSLALGFLFGRALKR